VFLSYDPFDTRRRKKKNIRCKVAPLLCPAGKIRVFLRLKHKSSLFPEEQYVDTLIRRSHGIDPIIDTSDAGRPSNKKGCSISMYLSAHVLQARLVDLRGLRPEGGIS
jgi:hypothetical protein